MTEEVINYGNTCFKCSLRIATQVCSCEQWLCSFCARNHWNTVKALEGRDHKFNDQDFPIPDPYLLEIMTLVEGVFNAALGDGNRLMAELDRKITECNYRKNRPTTYNEKLSFNQKLKELNEWKNKTDEILKFPIETLKYSKSLYQNLKKLQEMYSLINEIYSYINIQMNETLTVDFWKHITGPADNVIDAILVLLGDYSNISSVNNCFEILRTEDVLNVLINCFIMHDTFSNDFQSSIFGFLRGIRKNEKIGKDYREIFRKIRRKIRGKKDNNKEFIRQMYENWQSNQSKTIYIAIAWIIAQNTENEESFVDVVLQLQHWKNDNSMSSIYILIFQASVNMQRGDFIAGKACLNNALYILYETTGEDHPLASECMIWLAGCYNHFEDQNSKLSSLKLFEKALELQIKNVNWYKQESIINLLTNIQSLRAQLSLP